MILNVTPGINLNAVSGPISKSQINQLGQPVVTLSPGSVVTADTNFSSLKIEDATFPLIELRTTSGPTDKKFVRWTQDASGLVKVARVNDAYTFETALIYWDVSNNATLGAGTLTVNGGISGVQGTLKGAADNSAWSIVAGSSAPGVATAGAWLSLYGGTAATNPGTLVFGCNTAGTGAVTPGGNFGFGTLSPAARVHVVGGDFLLENNRKISMPDASGSAPSLICQSDNNFVFYGTGSAGAVRPVFQMLMRSDTSPLQVNVPLKIGTSGVPLKSVLTSRVTQTGTTISAGTSHLTNYTVTGAVVGAMVHIQEVQTNVILMARCNTNDSVQVWYGNPGAASVSLATQSIDIFVFNV